MIAVQEARMEIAKFAKFGLIGALTALIYFGVMAFFLELLYVDYKISVTIAYTSSVIFQFFSNRNFTFQSGRECVTGQIPRYLTLLGINYILSILIIHAVVEGIGFNPYLGVVISVPPTMIVGYMLSKFWVFKKENLGV